MITYRRHYLDEMLQDSMHLFKGRVIDIGGKKENKRGRFRPPLHQVLSWEYVNTDLSAKPDYLASAEQLPIPDESMDIAVMTEVLEYLDNPETALKEAWRVLKQGGCAIISVPFLNPVHGDWQFDRYRFTKVKLQDMAQNTGFRTIDIREMGSVGAVIFDILHAATERNIGQNKSRMRKRTGKLLRVCLPLFKFLEEITKRQSSFVTTGYFLRLYK